MFNRRKFLRNIGLAGAAVAAPVSLLEASPVKDSKGSASSAGETEEYSAIVPGKKDFSPIKLTGKVHSKGRGIKGVTVTDGINCTVTNESGSYELMSNKTVSFVYISIPSGYAFPNKDGITEFYKNVNKDSSQFRADFELEKLSVDDSKHAFVVWADPQIRSAEDAQFLLTESAPDLKKLVASYPSDKLFHGIGCGDLVWDKFDLFDEFRSAIAISGIPFFNVIGNHDMDLDARSDEYSTVTFQKQFGPTYYSYNRGKIHYVVLDDVFFVGVSKKYIGYLTEQQLSWLEQDLQNVKPGSTVVVSLHIPTNTGAARRNQKAEEMGGTVANREQLYKLLKPFKVHILSGHTHVCEHWEKDNIMEHVHGTVCGAWWTGPICSDGTPNGYGVYEVNGDELQWYHKSTGKERNHQLRIYGKNSIPDAPEEIVANVWNWDSKWKVEYFEDDVLKGEMTQRVGLDPMSVKLHGGPELPAKHKFVEPTKTDHLFFARPSENVRTIKVKATDRFGKIYEESISLV